MEKTFDAGAFLRDLYLASTPSIDLYKIPQGKTIRPGDHRILISKAEEIERQHGAEPGTELYVACGFLMLDRGPQLVNA